MTVTSRAFASNAAIPVDHTCDGRDALPTITWSAPPEGTKSLVLIVEDPDVSSGIFTHFVLFNLPADAVSVSDGANLAALGASVGVNDFGNARYNGPCPPKSEPHRYRFRVSALDAPLKLGEGAPRESVDAAMDGHLLGEGSLVGYFVH
jgi:Raf kinase inhibitor-like YbhB/YbcL family protein